MYHEDVGTCCFIHGFECYSRITSSIDDAFDGLSRA
eukprot:SAG11_NODE_13903_length_634_cov_0.811215_1_plen_35_part_01